MKNAKDFLAAIVLACLFTAIVYDTGKLPPEPLVAVRKAGW
jgi:hypothetical protein